jgi:hypothetical protein
MGKATENLARVTPVRLDLAKTVFRFTTTARKTSSLHAVRGHSDRQASAALHGWLIWPRVLTAVAEMIGPAQQSLCQSDRSPVMW